MQLLCGRFLDRRLNRIVGGVGHGGVQYATSVDEVQQQIGRGIGP